MVLSSFPGRLYQCGQVGGGNHDYVEERHRHRYEVNPDHVKQLEEAGMAFVGHSTDNTRMEIMELKGELVHS
jgi:CTP synthase (UTP-ammonia lyase)